MLIQMLLDPSLSLFRGEWAQLHAVTIPVLNGTVTIFGSHTSHVNSSLLFHIKQFAHISVSGINHIAKIMFQTRKVPACDHSY